MLVVVKAARFCVLAFFAALMFVLFPNPASARVSSDYIVVLDTSYSMAGKGGAISSPMSRRASIPMSAASARVIH